MLLNLDWLVWFWLLFSINFSFISVNDAMNWRAASLWALKVLSFTSSCLQTGDSGGGVAWDRNRKIPARFGYCFDFFFNFSY